MRTGVQFRPSDPMSSGLPMPDAPSQDEETTSDLRSCTQDLFPAKAQRYQPIALHPDVTPVGPGIANND